MENKNNFWKRLKYAFTGADDIIKTDKTTIDSVNSEGWMSPNQPMKPVETGYDKSQARQRDYRVGENLNYEPRGSELTKFEQLRNLADYCGVIRILIEKRKSQLAQLKYQFVKKVDGKTIIDDPDVKKITEFFKKPDGKNNFDTWMGMCQEEKIVIDALSINVVRNLGGEIIKLRVVDGSTIHPLINEWGEIPEDGINPAYQQKIKGVIMNNFTSKELIYRPETVRAHKLYGYSPVEQIQRTINLLLRKELDQLSYYTDGNMPDLLISVPESWNPDQIADFQDYWDEMNTGVMKKKAKVIPGGTGIHNTKPEPLKDEFDDTLFRIACAGLKLSPTAFVKDNNRATSQTQAKTAREEGLEADQEFFRNLINEIIKDHFELDVEFEWCLDDEKDPMEVAQLNQIYVQLGVKTVNEVRAELGLEPLSPEELAAQKPNQNHQEPDDDEGQPMQNKFFKKKSGKVNINDLEIIKDAQKKLEDILNEYFVGQKDSVLQYVNNLKLSKADNIDDELDLDGDESLISKVINAIKEYLTTIAVVSYKYTLNYVGKAKSLIETKDDLLFHDNEGKVLYKPKIELPDNELKIAINAEKKAIDYAGRRSAELIGKKVLKDGSIVDNPKAEYAISDTTRDGIKGLIDEAMNEGWSNQELAKKIEENHLFSATRSEMIARTETNLADNNVSVDTYKEAGIKRKRWLTAHDDKVDPCCTANENQGIIEMNAKFSSGSIAPPAHPRCRCTILAVFDDE